MTGEQSGQSRQPLAASSTTRNVGQADKGLWSPSKHNELCEEEPGMDVMIAGTRYNRITSHMGTQLQEPHHRGPHTGNRIGYVSEVQTHVNCLGEQLQPCS